MYVRVCVNTCTHYRVWLNELMYQTRTLVVVSSVRANGQSIQTHGGQLWKKQTRDSYNSMRYVGAGNVGNYRARQPKEKGGTEKKRESLSCRRTLGVTLVFCEHVRC